MDDFPDLSVRKEQLGPLRDRLADLKFSSRMSQAEIKATKELVSCFSKQLSKTGILHSVVTQRFTIVVYIGHNEKKRPEAETIRDALEISPPRNALMP